MQKETVVFTDTEEIASYIFYKLAKKGTVLDVFQVDEIANVIFEYLLEKEIITEIDEE